MVEPAVSNVPTFSGIVTLTRYQPKETLPCPRRFSSEAASIASHPESSKPGAPAFGV